MDVGNVTGFLGCGGQADLCGRGEVFQDFPPGRILGGAAAVAFVDHDQVEEAGREFTENLLVFLRPGDRLIEAEVDLVGRVDAALFVDGGGQVLGGPVGALDGFGVGRELGHRRTEGPEVVDHGLIDQHVAVGQEQDALFAARLPQPPDDLEGGVGLAGSGGHDQQDAVAALGDGLDGGVDGVDLIVARRLAAAVVEIVLKNDFLGLGRQALPGAIARPQVIWRRKGIGGERGFLGGGAGAVMEQEAVAVGGEYEGNVQRVGVVEGLLHAVADGMVVVLGFDQCDGQVGLVVEHVVGPLALAPADQLAAHDDAALGEVNFLADLCHLVPACLAQGRGDELGADVALAQALLVHGGWFGRNPGFAGPGGGSELPLAPPAPSL